MEASLFIPVSQLDQIVLEAEVTSDTSCSKIILKVEQQSIFLVVLKTLMRFSINAFADWYSSQMQAKLLLNDKLVLKLALNFRCSNYSFQNRLDSFDFLTFVFHSVVNQLRK